MSYIPIEEVLDKTGYSIYKLVVLAARRAIELNAGSPKLVETSSVKPTTISLEEIRQGRVRLKKKQTL